MSVHFMLATARKDLRRRLSDPAALLIWLALPVAIGGLLVLINLGDGEAPRGRLLVSDEDRSFTSALIGGIPGRVGLGELFEVVPVTRDEGRRLIDSGEATALLILPAGLQRAFAGDGKAEIRLVTNPSQRILPSVIEEVFEVVADSSVYTERVLADPALRPELLSAGLAAVTAPGDARLADVVERLDQRLREAGRRVLAPPVLRVELADTARAGAPESARAVADVGKVFLPGMIFLSILFIAQGMSGDVWDEKRLGTLRRAAASAPSLAAFLAGKLLAGASIAAVAAIVGMTTGLALFDLPLPHLPLAVLWVTFTGGVMLAGFVLLQLLASSQRAGDMLSNIVLFPVMMLGGSFFPLEMMPEWMAEIGRWTPNGAAVVRLREVLDARPDFPAMLVAALAIGLPGAIAFSLAVRRLSGRFLVS